MKTNSLKIGVVGTKATVASHAYKQTIQKYSPQAQVWEEACPLLVPLVEEGWMNHPITRQVAKEYLKPFLKRGIDTLVLGCTHYPLLKSVLQSIVGPRVSLIDSAEETARETKGLLEKKKLLNPAKRAGQRVYFVTDNPVSFTRLGRQFLGNHTSAAKRLSLDSF